jgi:hypothetical protein
MTASKTFNADLPHYFKEEIGKDKTYFVKESYCNSLSYESYKQLCEIPQTKASACGNDQVSQIYKTLKKFFIVLRGLKKYLDKYVNQTINAVTNLQAEITATINEIVAVLKSLVHRAREWVLKKVKKGLEDVLFTAETPQSKGPKKALLSRIIDEIFCKFDDIISGLFNLVGDFLYALIGQVINIPFCAAENFVNSLLSKLLTDIDNALQPIFDQINKVLAPISKIMGSVFQVVDYILGFEGFLCEKPECNDELKQFEAGPWGRPQNTKTDNWSNFSFSSSIGRGANQVLNDFFGKGSDGKYISPGGCYPGEFECSTEVQFFGGGGSAAVGSAVVNQIGQVVGVNLFYGGSGYTSPPFVSFVDSGGCGRNASGHTKIDNDTGEVTDVVIDNPGIGWTTQSPNSPIITKFLGTPNPIQVENEITLSWEVSNATKVSLGIPGYTNLPLVGSQKVAITSSDVDFPAGKFITNKTFTLTATNSIPPWSPLEIIRELNVQVTSPEGYGSTDITDPISTESPIINGFGVNPEIAEVGQVIKFTWSTSNATSVELGILNSSGNVTSIYTNLISNGSASLVLPNDLVFPSSGANLINTYVLTAINSKAPSGKNKDVKNTTVTIVSPTTLLPDWNFPSTPGATQIPIALGDITGTQVDNTELPGGANYNFNPNPSGSFLDILPGGGGGGGDIPEGGGGQTPEGGEDNTGGPSNSNSDFPLSGNQGGDTNGGGAGIDPVGSGDQVTPVSDSTGAGVGGGSGISLPIDLTGTGEIPGQIPIVGGDGGGIVITPNDVISEINEIEIIDTGSGYSPDDTIEIVGGNNNAQLELVTTPIGQIVDIKIISGGYGFTTLPEIRINTINGVGAKFRPILRFISASKFSNRELQRIGTDKLLKIVDCVIK